MMHKYQILRIEFNCSDEPDTEEHLNRVYSGTISFAEDENDLIERITSKAGCPIKSIDFKL